MQFKCALSDGLQIQVSDCDLRLKNPDRLKAVADTRLMDTPREIAFDRLAKMAALVLHVPVTIISIIGENRQFFKADFGLKAPFDTLREVPVDDSICRYTLAGQEIIAADTKVHPLLKDHPTTEPWGIAAFISIPMVTPEGHVIGTFCAIDPSIHPWSENDLSVMRELTKAVMTEIELRTQLDDLTQERTMREQFVAALSHDLRNPIGVAKMSAQLLSDDDSDANERKELVRMIQENMERADSMIADLLNVTSLKTGEKMQIKVTECNLETVARSTVETLEKMHRRSISLKIVGKLQGYWDSNGLRRVIENLVGNGIKYGAPNCLVSVEITAENSHILINVHNEGNPIPPEMIERIFEPFRRAEAAMRSSQKGWGIGLTIVRALVQAHGGEISVRSNASDGTTFSVTIPKDSRPHMLA
jgi:signal transduction histidine kinase